MIRDGSDESTTNARATFEAFGHVTRLELHVDVPSGTRPARMDAYTTQLEQQAQPMRQESEADCQRIACLEASQRDAVAHGPVYGETITCRAT